MNINKAKEILNKTECPFTWEFRSTAFECNSRRGLLKKLLNYLNDVDCPRDKPKWYVRALLAYVQFKMRQFVSASEAIDLSMRDLSHTEDSLSQKYMVSCQHIVYAMSAWVKFKAMEARMNFVTMQELEEAIDMIPPIENMSDLENAGLCGFKGKIIWDLAGRHIEQSIPFLKTAMELDPDEYEWMISTVAVLVRSERYYRKESKIITPVSESVIGERLDIIERILRNNHFTPEQIAAAKYYKTQTLEGYIRNRPRDSKVEEYCRQVEGLWSEIIAAFPLNSTYLEYGAKWYFEVNHQNLDRIFEAILDSLEMGAEGKSVRRAADLAMKHPHTCKDPACILKYSVITQRIRELVGK